MNQQPMTRDEAMLFADRVEDEPAQWRTTADRAALVLAAEVRSLNATLALQQSSYERERSIDQAEIERLQAPDAEARDAWLTEAMRLVHECTLKFSAMENDGESDGLPNWNAAKRKLREHLALGVVRG